MLSAMLDGFAIQIALTDPVVDAETAFATSMKFCADRLGFEWSPDTGVERGRVLARRSGVALPLQAEVEAIVMLVRNENTHDRLSRRRSPMPPGHVQLVGLCKRFAEIVAVDDLSLEIRRRRILLAPRAVGMRQDDDPRLVAGFEEPTVRPDHARRRSTWHGSRRNKRNVNTVFQSYALFPFLDVAGNVAFGLRYQSLDKVGDRKSASARCSSSCSFPATRNAG